MRVATLLLPACLALQASASWFGGSDSKKADVAPAQAVPEKAADPFAPEAEATAAAAQPQDATSPTEPTKPKARQQTILPTPTDWFNGVKPYSWQPYDGTEYKFFYDKLVIRPNIFRFEISALLFLFGFGLLFTMLRDANTARAMFWLTQARPELHQHFAKVHSGKKQTANAEGTNSSEAWLTQSSNSVFSCWATGRKHLRGLLIKFEFQPRGADLVGMVTTLAESIYDLTTNAQDRITLHFYLSDVPNADKAVFSLLRKGEMNRLREARWDIRAFTSAASVPQKYATAALNEKFSVFTEAGSVAETLMGALDKVGFMDWLRGDGEGQEYFESLTLSDIGETKNGVSDGDLATTDALRQDRQLSITFTLPKAAKKYGQTLPLFYLGMNLADMLSGPSGAKLLSNQEINKVTKRREDIVKGLTKEYMQTLRENQEEEKRAAKKKADDEKYAAMSAAQQKKYDELKKSRTERKASGKQQARVAQ